MRKMSDTPQQTSILHIHDTYIELPSGQQLALDALNSFSPNDEFLQLWHDSKASIKQAGVYISKENTLWRGYVHSHPRVNSIDTEIKNTQSDGNASTNAFFNELKKVKWV